MSFPNLHCSVVAWKTNSLKIMVFVKISNLETTRRILFGPPPLTPPSKGLFLENCHYLTCALAETHIQKSHIYLICLKDFSVQAALSLRACVKTKYPTQFLTSQLPEMVTIIRSKKNKLKRIKGKHGSEMTTGGFEKV